MSSNPEALIDLLLCVRRNTTGPLFHWSIMFRLQHATVCRRIHTIRSPDQPNHYAIIIDSNTLADVTRLWRLGSICAQHLTIVEAAVRTIKPQSSRTYCTALVLALEYRGLLVSGTLNRIMQQAEMATTTTENMRTCTTTVNARIATMADTSENISTGTTNENTRAENMRTEMKTEGDRTGTATENARTEAEIQAALEEVSALRASEGQGRRGAFSLS